MAESMDAWFETHDEYRIVADYVALPPDAEEVRDEFPEVGSDLLDKCMEAVTVGDLLITRGTMYVRARRAGESHRMAEMLAMQQAARAMTDDVFFSGMPTLADQMGSDKKLKRLVRVAQKHGYTPSPYDVYQSGLARFEGDPEAFISKTQGRGHIRRLCEKRGWACNGAVEVKARQPESDPLDDKNCVPMSNKLIKENARRMVRENPDLLRKKPAELRQIVLDKHGPRRK